MRRNVLIVEDDAAMRVILRQILNRCSLEIGNIYEAENGKIGLEMLEKYEVDFMLVDIYMPVMDGLEMLDYVANHPKWTSIPAVVISSENDEKRIEAILRKGLGFIHKEFTIDLLEDQIRKKLTEDK